MQVYEKYQQLARDASSSGDRVAAENLLQHAEHYYRLMVAAGLRATENRDDEGGDQRFDGDQRYDGDRAVERGGDDAPDRQRQAPQRAEARDHRDNSGGRDNAGGRDNNETSGSDEGDDGAAPRQVNGSDAEIRSESERPPRRSRRPSPGAAPGVAPGAVNGNSSEPAVDREATRETDEEQRPEEPRPPRRRRTRRPVVEEAAVEAVAETVVENDDDPAAPVEPSQA